MVHRLARWMTCLLPLPATAQTITNLGIPLGVPSSSGCAWYGVSNNGSAVGWCNGFAGGRAYAFRWTVAGGLQNLGPFPGGTDSYGRAISANGAVVAGYGYAAGFTRPFRWNGGMQNLGVLLGYDDSLGYAISADGSAVAGKCYSRTTELDRAFRWTVAGGWLDLGVLPGMTRSSAHGISGDGAVVVGDSSAPLSGGRAFRWTSANGMQDLGTLPGGSSSGAAAANADGTVIVGNSGTNGGSRAVRWTSAGEVQNLGVLPGTSDSGATSVSADGSVVVGHSGNPVGYPTAFLWTPELGMVSVESYLSSLGVNVTGWQLTGCLFGGCVGVSPNGRALVGYGIFNGEDRGWIVTGLPRPCYPNCDASTNSPLLTANDFICFITKFAAADPYANCDGSTGAPLLTGNDFICFITAFAAGCS